jgi:hypothetical protein
MNSATLCDDREHEVVSEITIELHQRWMYSKAGWLGFCSVIDKLRSQCKQTRLQYGGAKKFVVIM